jgi:hypothetical protein
VADGLGDSALRLPDCRKQKLVSRTPTSDKSIDPTSNWTSVHFLQSCGSVLFSLFCQPLLVGFEIRNALSNLFPLRSTPIHGLQPRSLHEILGRCFSGNDFCESHSLIDKWHHDQSSNQSRLFSSSQIYGEIVKVSCPAVDRWVNGFNHKGILG